MSIGLHKNCLKRLCKQLSDKLPLLDINNGMFLSSGAASFLRELDATIPQGERKKLEKSISETPVSDFVSETLSRELHKTPAYDASADSVRLTNLRGYEDPKAVAERLIGDFESLPWQYSLAIKLDNALGSSFARALKRFHISESMELLTPDDDFIKEFPAPVPQPEAISLSAIYQLLSHPPIPAWDQAACYLRIKMSGFIGFYAETATLQEAISLLKAFCGVAIALRLANPTYLYQTAPRNEALIVHRRLGDAWILDRDQELGRDLSEGFRNLAPFHLVEEGKAAAQDKWMMGQLERLHCVFTRPDKAEKIILASQWLFDSYCGSNELLSFVQAVIAMEILLGDKGTSDLIGLGELLRNRCAYLIGVSQEQREEILNDFKKIYDVRCQVVHRGKSRLGQEERDLFGILRWICRRVIDEEVRLLQGDVVRLPSFTKLIGNKLQ